MIILHQDCDPELSNDRTLPYNSYLVSYEVDNTISHDLIITNKKIEIFDYYWDRYREGLIGWKQSEGRINPKVWGNIKPNTNKKK